MILYLLNTFYVTTVLQQVIIYRWETEAPSEFEHGLADSFPYTFLTPLIQ